MKSLLIILFCFSSVSVVAQISGSSSARNIMSKGSRASKAQLSARLTIDGNYQTGNTEKANVAGNVLLAAIDSIKEFSANGRFIYSETNKIANQREYAAGIQYDYHPLAMFSPFVRCEFYKNEFKKIDGRYSGLVGFKYHYFVRRDVIDYSISAAFIYDREHYQSETDLPDRERWRISVRPKFKHALSESVRLSAEVFYKPNIFDFNDFIVYGNYSLNIRIFKWGLARLSFEHEYNSRPATVKVKKTDALLLAGLGIEF